MKKKHIICFHFCEENIRNNKNYNHKKNNILWTPKSNISPHIRCENIQNGYINYISKFILKQTNYNTQTHTKKLIEHLHLNFFCELRRIYPNKLNKLNKLKRKPLNVFVNWNDLASVKVYSCGKYSIIHKRPTTEKSLTRSK